MHDAENELTCDAALELQALALDAELDSPRAEALAAHLERCASCREVARELEADLERRSGLAPRPLPAEFFARVQAATTGAPRVPITTTGARRIVRALPWLIAAASIVCAFLAWRRAPRIERIEVPGPVVVRELRVEVPAAPPAETASSAHAPSVRLVLDTRPLAIALRAWSTLAARHLEREAELRRSELAQERALLAQAALERACYATAHGIERGLELAVRALRAGGATSVEPVLPEPSLAALLERPQREIAPVEVLATPRGTRLKLRGDLPDIVGSLQALTQDERSEVAALARAHLDELGIAPRR